MERLIRYGRFGAFYGSWSIVIVSCTFVICTFIYEWFYNWPANGTREWFIEGAISSLLITLIGSYVLGFTGGFAFGLCSSAAKSPLGWAASGVIGGFAPSCLLFWLGSLTVISHPIDIPRLITIFAVICLTLGAVGYFIGRSIERGHPKIPRLYWIEDE